MSLLAINSTHVQEDLKRFVESCWLRKDRFSHHTPAYFSSLRTPRIRVDQDKQTAEHLDSFAPWLGDMLYFKFPEIGPALRMHSWALPNFDGWIETCLLSSLLFKDNREAYLADSLLNYGGLFS